MDEVTRAIWPSKIAGLIFIVVLGSHIPKRNEFEKNEQKFNNYNLF